MLNQKYNFDGLTQCKMASELEIALYFLLHELQTV